jgi:hypothetical protein
MIMKACSKGPGFLPRAPGGADSLARRGLPPHKQEAQIYQSTPVGGRSAVTCITAALQGRGGVSLGTFSKGLRGAQATGLRSPIAARQTGKSLSPASS